MTDSDALSSRHVPRLVVFDVEGVVIPKRRYLLFEASREMSILGFIKMLWAGFLYEAGISSLETALRKVFRQLRGLALSHFFQFYKQVPLMQGAVETFEQLKKAGCKIALISSGVPQMFIKDLGIQLGCDYALGLDFEVVDGRLTGEISGDVIKREGKAIVLEKIQQEERLTPQDCALVADDRNNLQMFKLCATRIGYNPDFMLSNKSDAVVRGDLTETLPFLISGRTETHSVTRRDLVRESIHLSGLLVAVVTFYLSLNLYFVAFIIFLVTLTYAGAELSRMHGKNVPLISAITWRAAIQPEMYEFVTSPIYFATGIALTLLVFPQPINYAAIAVFTIGDVSATIFGKELGKHTIPYNKGKKIEGTVFGLLFAALGAYMFTLNPLKAIIAATAGMIVESLPLPINDNMTIPLIAGLTLLLIP